MFERYTESARRAIFFARYEASQFGSPYIELGHLLLGLVKENKELEPGLDRENVILQYQLKKASEHPISTSIDLPLSNATKRALGYGQDIADRCNIRRIDAFTLYLGVRKEEGDKVKLDAGISRLIAPKPIKIKPGVYQHFKGKTYRVHGTARHSETGQDLVVYEPLYQSVSRFWVRPINMFTESVTSPEGILVPRFSFLYE